MIVVEFPLISTWVSPNTPGEKVPSHGTDIFGQRYAYDFVGIDPQSKSARFYRSSAFKYLLSGVRLQDCYGWGRPIYAASAGTVVLAIDGWPERDPVNLVRDLNNLFKQARKLNSGSPPDFQQLAGNHIIMETRDGYAVYAHAQAGSIKVSSGDKIDAGQHLANVGHSGNSTAPHLHFQLMDHQDPTQAQGILCGFREYEIYLQGRWQVVENGIPKAKDRIRRR